MEMLVNTWLCINWIGNVTYIVYHCVYCCYYIYTYIYIYIYTQKKYFD